jgi:hypothetical protein
MDITANAQVPTVEWAPVARTMMEQLSAEEQAEVRSSVERIVRRFDLSLVNPVQPARQERHPFFVLRATPSLRVFFERANDRVRVLDVIGAEQWAYFRDDVDSVAP